MQYLKLATAAAYNLMYLAIWAMLLIALYHNDWARATVALLFLILDCLHEIRWSLKREQSPLFNPFNRG